MEQTKKQQLIEQLQAMRSGGDTAVSVTITATTGQITIKKQHYVNSLLDFLMKELQTSLARDLEGR